MLWTIDRGLSDELADAGPECRADQVAEGAEAAPERGSPFLPHGVLKANTQRVSVGTGDQIDFGRFGICRSDAKEYAYSVTRARACARACMQA